MSELFAGFRGESLSLYFSQDLVFHFNDRGELRRAFIADLLLKSEDGRLIAMRRERTDAEVLLLSRSLEEDEERALLADLERRLRELAEALAADSFRIVGEAPADGNAAARLRMWLTARTGPIGLAASSHVG